MITENSKRSWAFVALVALAMVLGGGSSIFPGTRLFVELAGVIALAIAVGSTTPGQFRAAGGMAFWLALAIIAVVLLQLVPLPPALWSGLPGREIVTDLSVIMGEQEKWRPISLDWEASLRAAYCLIPAFALFFGGLVLTEKLTFRLLAVVLGGGIIGLFLGLIQLSMGDGSPLYLYESLHQGLPLGFFSNRNHLGILLAILPPVSAAVALELQRRDPFGIIGRMNPVFAVGAIAMICLLGVLSTGSRSASALFPLSLAGAILMVVPFRNKKMASLVFGAILLLCIAFMALLVFAGSGAAVGLLGDRTAAVDDNRFRFWPDVIFALNQFLPFGSGFGTFEPVFNSVERLSIVGLRYINHAHNDYLEVVLESGLYGVALILAFWVWFAIKATSVWRGDGADSRIQLGRMSSVALALLAVHSVVDYPLRTLTLSALFGLFSALLARAPWRAESSEDASA